MEVKNYHAYEKGTLRGFFELALDSGLLVKGMTYHQKNSKRWVAFPSKPYEDDAGETKWQNILAIPDEQRWRRFQQLALAALDAHFATHREDELGDIPF